MVCTRTSIAATTLGEGWTVDGARPAPPARFLALLGLKGLSQQIAPAGSWAREELFYANSTETSFHAAGMKTCRTHPGEEAPEAGNRRI